MYELKITTFPVGHRGPLEDSSRAGCGPWAGRCAPLNYIKTTVSHGLSLQLLCANSQMVHKPFNGVQPWCNKVDYLITRGFKFFFVSLHKTQMVPDVLWDNGGSHFLLLSLSVGNGQIPRFPMACMALQLITHLTRLHNKTSSFWIKFSSALINFWNIFYHVYLIRNNKLNSLIKQAPIQQQLFKTAWRTSICIFK